jgi:hypothetical protein
MTVIEVGTFEPEWRYRFDASSPGGPHVVVSGNGTDWSVNGESDEKETEYEVRMVVGPFWGGGGVVSVVPIVVVSRYRNLNSDEDDMQGWSIAELTWDAVSGTGPNSAEERIRLKFKATVQGQYSQLPGFGYYLTARGRQLGAGGLNSPGPVHPNP